MIQLTAPVALAAAAYDDDEDDKKPRRAIMGVAVPWNVDATVMDGSRVRFAPGALAEDGPAPKLVESHDMSQIRGLVTSRRSTDAGMEFTAKIAATRAGDDVLELLKMGAIDSVSVGVNPTKWSYDDNGTMVIQAGDWMELSLVAVPAFAAAQITQVAATIPTVPKEDTPMADATITVEAEAPTIMTTPTLYAQAKRPFKMPSLTEYLAAMHRGGHDFAQMNANIKAAAGDDTTTDTPGLLPTPVVAPIFDDINPIRPVVSALGPRAMPGAGKVFIRPKITTHTSAANQATELTGLSSTTMVINDLQVTKKTFGGTVLLSEQVIDFADPSMLTAVLTDLAGQYALATEKEAIDTLVAGMSLGNLQVVSDFTDSAEVIADIYDAAYEIAETGNYFPNVMVVSPKRWATLGKLVDGSDRPVFPQTAPINGIGTLPGGVTAGNGNPLGLNLIVSNQVTTQAYGNQDAVDYLWLMTSRALEVYEQQKGAISIEVPSTLGRQVSFRGYFAALLINANEVRLIGPAVS